MATTPLGQLLFDLLFTELSPHYLARKHGLSVMDIRDLRDKARKAFREAQRSRKTRKQRAVIVQNTIMFLNNTLQKAGAHK